MIRRIAFCFLSLLCVALSGIANAQVVDTLSTFTISGYVDAYYAHYTDDSAGKFQKFPTVSPRNDQLGLNTAQLMFDYKSDKVRGTAAFHFGDIPSATWSPTYPYIMEAHAGIKFFKNMWLDAGFFRTHFGTEFLLPVENITSSVAVGTYYEPYYEAGARLSYDATSKMEINLFLLNGYGIFEDNNKRKSLGMGVTYVLNDNLGFGYTNYIGNDSPDSIKTSQTRIAQNLFLNYQRKKIKVQLGADYFIQQNSNIATHNADAYMFSALATLRYQAFKKAAVYARGEMFNDPDGFVSGVFTDAAGSYTGYKLWGVTAGAEYKPTENSYIRIESRRLQMQQDEYVFNYNGEARNYRWEFMVNMGVTFDLLKSLKTR